MEEQLEARLRAHIQSLTEALKEKTDESVRLQGQLYYLKEAATRRLKEACTLIDRRTETINVMVEAWHAHIESFVLLKEQKQLLHSEVEPFRPRVLGEATLEDDSPTEPTP